MPNYIDAPAGTVFGRLTVIEPARTPGGRCAFLCRCECGQEKIVDAANLRSGNTISCGCLHREQLRQRSTRHGLRHHEHYARWGDMTGRCLNPEHPSFQWYGGRGVTVCPEWRDPAAFCAWMDANMGPCPPGMSLDRIDNDGNYEPGNVRWNDNAGQARNTRLAKLTMDIAEEIRRRCAAGELQSVLAAEFSVDASVISRVAAGKTWWAH
jgi:hypothetical protein